MSYRDNPEWRQARATLIAPECATASEDLFARMDAIRVMYRIESEAELAESAA